MLWAFGNEKCNSHWVGYKGRGCTILRAVWTLNNRLIPGMWLQRCSFCVWTRYMICNSQKLYVIKCKWILKAVFLFGFELISLDCGVYALGQASTTHEWSIDIPWVCTATFALSFANNFFQVTTTPRVNGMGGESILTTLSCVSHRVWKKAVIYCSFSVRPGCPLEKFIANFTKR